jgi:two-component system response regulator DegU
VAEITVLIADDHPVFRQGLRQLIASAPGLKVIAEAEDGAQALEQILACKPQVAVLDVDMPHQDGYAVARRVRQLRLDVGLIFLTMHKEERFFNAALDVGVNGYLLKDSAISEIIGGIKAVAAGQHYITPSLTDYLLKRRQAQSLATQQTGVHLLTQAERRILKLIAEYKTSKEIADDLFISIRTVDRHRANIAGKLDLKGAHALLQFALEHKAVL